MKISNFFIERPIFAGVISAFITIAGLLALFKLPISEYPEVVPPPVVVHASYPGANPKVIADTVAAPLEQAIVGVEDMLYMSSTSTMDGALTLTVTFKIGADIDRAQVQVQNRVAQALPRLPEEVRNLGVNTVKASSNLTLVVNLTSPSGRYDSLYLRNYAVLNIKDVLARLPGMGDVQVFGGGDYSMRVWLDPQKLAARNLTAGDVVAAIREQNVQVAAGQLGAPPSPDTEFQIALNAAGRLTRRAAVPRHHRQDRRRRAGRAPRRCRARRARRAGLRHAQPSRQQALARDPGVPVPGRECAASSPRSVRKTMEELKKNFPEGMDYGIVYDPTQFVRQSIEAVRAHAARGRRAGRAGRHPVPADLARLAHSADRGAGLGRSAPSRCCSPSASRSTRCRSSAWCSPSASWSTMPSSSSRTSSATSPQASRPARPPRWP